MTGTLYLVGVGPGDPELLTLKAVRILGTADVVAYPSTGDGVNMALDIARAHVDASTELLAVDIPMSVRLPNGDFAPKDHIYEGAAEAIEARLAAGRNVAYLCEGDPLFYGSAMYLLSRFREGRRTEVVPGITSLTAAAAAIPLPLVARLETLTILPAPLPDEALRDAMQRSGSIAVLKVGRHFDRVRALLGEAGRDEGAWLVEYASDLDRQRIVRLADAAAGEKPYFSLVLSFSDAERWQ